MSARVPLIVLICPYTPCSKPFEIHPRIVRGAAKLGKKCYCSPACGRLGSALARRTSVTLICAYAPCSKPFQAYAHTLKRTFKFRCCSRTCQNRQIALMRFPGTFEEKFWAQVARSGPDECWPWQGRTNWQGYGQINVPEQQRDVGVHIVAWFFAHGRWPLTDMDICHSCDNLPCTNEAHLWEGTPYDNTHDAFNKGRMHPPSGERHWKSKLTDIQWQTILTLLAEGHLSKRQIAQQHGITPASIRDRLKRVPRQ
jgi:HNH endonuclease